MIKTSAYGIYDISLDGGKTFIHHQKNLILNHYYNKTFLTEAITIVVGGGNTPPQLTDDFLVAEFGSATEPLGFDPSSENKVFTDRFEIKYIKLFDLGVGYAGTMRELGIENPSLCSRALLSTPTGVPTQVTLVHADHLVIRYSIVYVIPRTPQVFALTINGTPVNATMTAVNGEFNGWGKRVLGEVVRYDYIGSAAAGTWTIDANGNVIGGNIAWSEAIPITTNVNGIAGLSIVGTAMVPTDKWNGSFQQLLITSSGVDYITAPILIDLDVPVLKSATDILNISVNVNQSI